MNESETLREMLDLMSQIYRDQAELIGLLEQLQSENEQLQEENKQLRELLAIKE